MALGLRGDRRRTTLHPLRIAAYLSAGAFALGHFCEIYFQKSLTYVVRLRLGNDFSFFFQAAENIAAGVDPYLIKGFVTPPTISRAIASIGAATLPIETAAQAMFFVTIFCLLATLAISVTVFFSVEARARGEAFFLGLLLIGTGFPTFFLVDRGNVDGIVVLFVTVFLALLYGKRNRDHEILAGLALAVAVGIKVYPVVLLLPVLIYRRWSVLVAFATTLTALVLWDPEGWRYFATVRAAERASWIRLDETSGIFTFFGVVAELFKTYVGIAWPREWITGASLGSLGVMVSALALKDFSSSLRGRNTVWRSTLLYVPFTVTLPQLAHNYMLVNLIPFAIGLCLVAQRDRVGPVAMRFATVAGIGIGLCQIQVIAFAGLFSAYFPYVLVAASGSVGLVVVLGGTVLFRLTEREEGFRPSSPRKKVSVRNPVSNVA